jgi:hypothetical protein
MSAFREYQTLDPVIDFWTTVRRSNGRPRNGEDVRVAVFDSDTNTEILFQSMPEIGNTGYYKFRWEPSFITSKYLFATIFVRGSADDRRTIIDTIDIVINNKVFDNEEKIDENDGLAI